MKRKRRGPAAPHRGFVALEVMAVLAIVAMASLIGAEKYSEYLDEREWSVTATHASTFNAAAKHYIADHTDTLLTKPLPFLVTPSLLIKNGYLPPGFAEKNVFGQGYVTGVVKSSGKSKTPLQALTCSVSGDPLSEKGMRSIAAQLPGLGGYVDNNHIATGAYGGWTSRPRDFGVDCRYGHIAIALSSEVLGSALQESDRLYRFEVKQRPELNRMHTAIDMGENNLNNAGTVNAKNGNFAEDVTVGRDISSQRWLNSEHGGGFYMADNDWIRAVNDKGITTGGQLKGGTVKAEGRLSTQEFLHLEERGAVKPDERLCSPNGLVGRTPEGGLLFCQSGVWRTPGQVRTVVRESSGWSVAGVSCLDNEVMTGGGAACYAGSDNRLKWSSPSGNGWAAACPHTTVTSYAICASR